MFKTVAQLSTMGDNPQSKGTVITFDLENPQLPPYVILKRSSVVWWPGLLGFMQDYRVDEPVWEYGTKSEPYPALVIQDDILYIHTEWMIDVTLDIEYLDLRTNSFQSITLAPVGDTIQISADTFGTSVYIFSFCLNQKPLLNTFYHDFTKHHLKFPEWLTFNRASKAMVLDDPTTMWREAAEDEPRFFKMRDANENKILPNSRHPYAQGLTFEAGSVNLIPHSFNMAMHITSMVGSSDILGLTSARGPNDSGYVMFTLGETVDADKITLTNCGSIFGTSFGYLLSDRNVSIGELTTISYAVRDNVAFYYDSNYYAFYRPFTLKNTDGAIKSVNITVSEDSHLLIPQMEYSESGDVITTAIKTIGTPVARAVEILNVLTPRGRKFIDINYNLPINGESDIQTKTITSTDSSRLIVAGSDIPYNSSIIKGVKVYGDSFPDNLEIDLDKSNGTLPEFMRVNRPTEQYHINHLGEAVYVPPDQPRFHSILVDGVRLKRGLILTNHNLEVGRNEVITTTLPNDIYGVTESIITASPARPYMTIVFKSLPTNHWLSMNMTAPPQNAGGEYVVRLVIRLRGGGEAYVTLGVAAYFMDTGNTRRDGLILLSWNDSTNQWDMSEKSEFNFTVNKSTLRQEGDLLFIMINVTANATCTPSDLFFRPVASAEPLSLDIISASYTKSEYPGWYNVPEPYTGGVVGNLETLDIHLPRGVYSNLVYTYQYTDDNFELTAPADHTLMVPANGKVTIQPLTTHETYIRKIKLVK